MHYTRITLFIFLVSGMFFIRISQAKDWPQWRGPSRNGVAENFDAPKTWPDSLRQIWRVPVEAGLSSPIVADGRAFLLARGDGQEIVTCFDLENGKIVWQQSYASPFIPNPQAVLPQLFPKTLGKGPFATPLLHAGNLYTLNVNRTLSCFNIHTGDLQWQRHFLKQEIPQKPVYECPPCGCSEDGKVFDAPGTCPACGMAFGVKGLDTSARQLGNYYGAASSPLVVDNLGVVNVGNGDLSLMIAFDLQTSQEKWQWQGPGVSSSSPVIAELNGSQQIITLTRESVIGIAVENGELLWSFPLQSNAQIVTPVIFEDKVIYATYRGPIAVLEIKQNRGQWSAQEVWQNSELTLETSSPVLADGKLYGFFYSRRGQFACLNPATGDTIWTSDGRQGRGAALIVLQNAILALTNEGELIVIDKNSDSYRPLAKYSVAATPTWAYPAVWDTSILIKDESHLTLWSVE